MPAAVQIRVRDALVPGVINAVINGAIAYGTAFSGAAAVPLSLDLISSRQHTVWGQGVTLAFALGIILSLLTARSFAKRVAAADPALAPRVQRSLLAMAGIALGIAMSLFGWFVSLAVLWQRIVGTIEVSPLAAAALVGLLAGLITVIVETRTKHAIMAPQ